MKSLHWLAALMIGMLIGCASPVSETPTVDPVLLVPEVEASLIPPLIMTNEPATPTETVAPAIPAPTPIIPDGDHYRQVAALDLKGRILDAALSPDGASVAVVCWDGVYLYDAYSLELRWHYAESVGWPSIGWLNADEILLMHSTENPVLDAASGSVLREVRFSGDDSYYISTNGQYLAHALIDGYSVIDVETRLPIFELPQSDFTPSLYWLPDGEHLIYFDYDIATVWNAAAGEPVTEIDSEFILHEIWYPGFSADGRYMADQLHEYSNDTNAAVVWDLQTGAEMVADTLDGTPADYGWRFDDETIITDDGLVVRLTVSGAQAIQLPMSPHKVLRLRDGFLAMFSDAIIRYDTHFSPVVSAEGHTSAGEGDSVSALSPDGAMLAIGQHTRYYVWQTELNQLATIEIDLRGMNGADAAWSPSGSRLAIGAHRSADVHLWDAQSGQTQRFSISTYVCEVEWLDERRLALTLTEEIADYGYSPCPFDREGDSLGIFDTVSGEMLHLERRDNHPNELSLSPDGQYLLFTETSDIASNNSTTTLYVIDAKTYQEVFSSESTLDVHWIPESHRIAGIDSEEVRIVDLDTLQEQTIPTSGIFSRLGVFLPLAHSFVNVDDIDEQVQFMDWNGNIVSEPLAFWSVAALPVLSPNGHLYLALNPNIGDGDVFVLLELLPPASIP